MDKKMKFISILVILFGYTPNYANVSSGELANGSFEDTFAKADVRKYYKNLT